jgi:hypothetical protein
MFSRTILFIFFAFFLHGINAQDLLTITGKVTDSNSGKPVAYAHVGIPEKGIGTTTGNNGAFTFKIPMEYQNSQMIVSYIGYKTYKKSVRSIEGPVTVKLKKSAAMLNEVVVMGETTVEDIVRKAVKNIKNNYPVQGTSYLGFYRESRTDDSLKYVYLAEGVLNIYKRSYKSKKEGYVSLVQGRKINIRNPLDTSVQSGFSSGHMAPHRFDFVQNRTDFIDTRFFKVYNYWIESITTYNDRPVYIIGFEKNKAVTGPQGEVEVADNNSGKGLMKVLRMFKKKKRTIEARMKGRIYIDQESYAFIRAEFEMTPEGLEVREYYPLYAGSWRGNSYVVNYRELDGKWYFSDAIREGIYGGGGIYTNEIKITEVKTGKSEAIPYLERIDRGTKFTRMTGVYDEDFWESYNVTPLNAALAESVQQLNNSKKANEVFDQEYMAALREKRDSVQKIKTLEARAELGSDRGVDFDIGEPGFKKRKRPYERVKFMIGLGSHFIKTDQQQLSIAYLSPDPDFRETIISIENEIPSRDFEIVAYWGMDIFVHKNYFIRFGTAFDFYNSIYKEKTLGFGGQVNLSKQRPFYVRAVASYSHLRYNRKVGQAQNEYGAFKADRKKFKADNINMYYGSTSHNVSLSGELSLELNPDRELYIRGSYVLPFYRRQDIWLWERKEIFRRKRHVPVKSDQVLVTQNGLPFNSPIAPDQSFSVSVGILFK